MRNRYVLLADLAGVALAAFGAFALRFDWFAGTRPEFVPFLAAALLLKPSVFYGFGLYRRFWNYASIHDLLVVVIAVASASLVTGITVVTALMLGYFAGFSRTVLLIDVVLTVVLISGIRLTIRLATETRGRGRAVPGAAAPRRVLVVGAGDAGILVTREMQRNPKLGMIPVGFLDDARVKIGKRIYGLPVIGSTNDLETVARTHAIDEIVIAMPAAPGTVVRHIVDAAQRARVRSRMIPGVYEVVGGAVSVSRLRDVDITDLLRRTQVTWPNRTTHLAGAVVLVTGAGGSIGLELCRQVAYARPRRLVMLGHGENSIFEAEANVREMLPGTDIVPVIADVRDPARLARVFAAMRPDIVFHAAAHKHVPLMEVNPEEAVSNNVVGTANVVEAATAAGVQRLVLISTDKAVSPVSFMGASKRLAEMVVRDAAERTGRTFVVVRFGNVLGSRGSVLSTFRRQVERGGPLTLTHPDMSRFFMTISEAVHLVIEASGIGRGGELFVLDMGAPVRIVDLARDLIRLSGLTDDEMPIVFTGTRPGEKLSERLWEDGAVVEPTSHPAIMKITEPQLRSAPAQEIVRLLGDAASRGCRLDVEALFAIHLPTFAPILKEQLDERG